MLPSDAVSPGKVVHLKSHLAHPWLPPCPPMVTTAAFMHVSVPMAGIPGFEGPLAGPSAPVCAPFRLRRSALWTLSACLGPIPASKVRSLDPQRLFVPHSGFEGPLAGPSVPVWAPFRLRRSTRWTLSACLGPIPASKVRSLDPQRLFGPHSGFEGPLAGPSAPVWAPFRLRRSIPWTVGGK